MNNNSGHTLNRVYITIKTQYNYTVEPGKSDHPMDAQKFAGLAKILDN